MKIKKFSLIVSLLVLFFLWKTKSSNDVISTNPIQENKFDLNSSYKVMISRFSLKDPIEPKDIYDNIKCRKSIIKNINTTLCIHDLEKDVFVSKSIWLNGVWEGDILENFLNSMTPEHLIFDIGAHIGQYTLFSSKAGNKVVTVEPFYENLIRIHKACKIEGLEERIILVNNAISNKRGQIKKLNQNMNNIGGQNINENEQNLYSDSDLKSNRYLARTICLDDLVTIIPKKDNGQIFSKAIIKFDIEGHESIIFECASEFFKKINVEIIFMEWMNVATQKNTLNVENTIKFLLSREFLPYNKDSELKISEWRQWPSDIIWKKIKL